jgi:uncharacterized membrane protein YkoI
MGFRSQRTSIGEIALDIRSLLFALIAGSTAAAASTPATPVMALGDVVRQLEARYAGKVIAIALDDAGDRSAHYHVDMSFPASGLARLDVNAATLEVASRESAPLAAGSASLVGAAALVAQAIPGEVLVAELDATNGVPAHYDVDVRLPQGAIARLKVDPATLQIGWRSPAIRND